MPGMKTVFAELVGAVAGFLMVSAAAAADVSGGGASFPYPLYAKWAAAYKSAAGVGINHQSIGSGGGIAQIKAKTVTFGATDAPLQPAELDRYGLAQFPTVIGGVVPVVNIAGIAPGKLTLDGQTLAAIFLGKIVKWNDPAIKALNPDIALPPRPIVTVHRSDGSGTSFIFTSYLSLVSADWRKRVGANTSVAWPLGVGAKGNEGVTNNVKTMSGSIGYVEYAYAKQGRLSFARMINRDGKAVLPNAASFEAAAQGVDWAAAGRNGFSVVLVDRPGATSWPIVANTYILVYKRPIDPVATGDVLKFFKWAFAKGDALASSLDYVPLPDAAVRAVEDSWKQIQLVKQ
jgi:phosphate transport system substrate-binding protein